MRRGRCREEKLQIREYELRVRSVLGTSSDDTRLSLSLSRRPISISRTPSFSHSAHTHSFSKRHSPPISGAEASDGALACWACS
eukprot:3835938-Rhodomonas_salina.1